MNKNLGKGNSISASSSNCICYCFSMTHVHISISASLLDVLSYAEDNNNRYILRKPVHHIISCWTVCFFCWHEQLWNLKGVKCNSMFVYITSTVMSACHWLLSLFYAPQSEVIYYNTTCSLISIHLLIRLWKSEVEKNISLLRVLIFSDGEVEPNQEQVVQNLPSLGWGVR